MTENMIMAVIKDAITTGILVAAPILIISIVVGLIISIFQAATQIQEQTLTFVPKIIAAAVIGIIAGPWMLHTLVSFTQRIFENILNITQ
ncbi:flagellar biosynthetic protein FliQ [Clostridium sp. USBA 49]|jgi:flagellar biosynthetic protein FliQ|uniref:flagellar biosynthesis protein FliQ n=1 Tax=Clostridium TaxID=1485 RepID=UPI00099A9043|nr:MULTISPECIES: flagellar biosynthesis protein FliQ [Clostridium]SKA72657.1 flagellar biosynthetic protein FliQ [Clostridium sp. USBA 49]